MKIPKTKNESKLRHPPLAPVEELVLETSGGEMPEVKVGVNREFSNAHAIFSEKNPAKKKNRKNVGKSNENQKGD
jgi:hypothetical protein